MRKEELFVHLDMYEVDTILLLVSLPLRFYFSLQKKYFIMIQFNAPSALGSFTRRPFDDFRLIITHLIPLKC